MMQAKIRNLPEGGNDKSGNPGRKEKPLLLSGNREKQLMEDSLDQLMLQACCPLNRQHKGINGQ